MVKGGRPLFLLPLELHRRPHGGGGQRRKEMPMLWVLPVPEKVWERICEWEMGSKGMALTLGGTVAMFSELYFV
ncbi:hypothetical protein V6N13_089735 [Hibiscus sabdariffa]|uniref:Uncharacterized protein n=1 Tax=Hibiscus sabdariffa TaxID=183260 RepID=A0ABR2QJF1_9ROSI